MNIEDAINAVRALFNTEDSLATGHRAQADNLLAMLTFLESLQGKNALTLEDVTAAVSAKAAVTPAIQ